MHVSSTSCPNSPRKARRGSPVAASFNWKTGNTNILRATASLSAAYRKDKHLVFFMASNQYGTNDDVVYINRTFEHIRYRRTLLEWLSVEGFGQHALDEFRHLKARTVLGGGPRFTVNPIDGIEVSLGTAYMVEYEVFSPFEGWEHATPKPEINHRWSSYIQIGYQIQEDLSIHHTTYAQPRLDGSGPICEPDRCRKQAEPFVDYLLLSQSALVIEANDWLATKISLDIAWDNDPPGPRWRYPEKVKKLDTALETTLSLSF
ncbi:DUF481 domain-containing protein [Myxococcota bacterium]